jgi:hypothetical protein
MQQRITRRGSVNKLLRIECVHRFPLVSGHRYREISGRIEGRCVDIFTPPKHPTTQSFLGASAKRALPGKVLTRS